MNVSDFDPNAALADLVSYLRSAGVDIADTGVVRRQAGSIKIRVYARHDGSVAVVERVHSTPPGRRILRPLTDARTHVTVSPRLRLLGEMVARGVVA